MPRATAVLLLALALAACRQPADENVAAPAVPSQNVEAEPKAPQVDTPAQSSATNSSETAAATFPAALHGRWGLVPGDCTSGAGDAKGLVTISAEEVRFYESVARPAKVAERTDRVIRGEFDFTGEGLSWTNYMTWSVTGDRLTRVDSEEDSRLVYTRC